jgi:hypothetical protein
MKPQSKLWKQIPQQAAGYYTLRVAGLFNLPIPLRLAFGIGVSRITHICGDGGGSTKKGAPFRERLFI